MSFIISVNLPKAQEDLEIFCFFSIRDLRPLIAFDDCDESNSVIGVKKAVMHTVDVNYCQRVREKKKKKTLKRKGKLQNCFYH